MATHLSPSISRIALGRKIVEVHNVDPKTKEFIKSKAIRIPRIIYAGRIIIGRKTWLIHRETLPIVESGESEWEYFLRINEWRMKMEIPDEVFITIIERDTPVEILKKMKEVSRDDYKPIYIDFWNPFLVKLFQKSIKRVAIHLKITEMLPNSNQLLKINGEEYVTESTVQWYD